MHFFIIGINHKTAPIALREKIAFANETLDKALKDIIKKTQIQQIVILSTCNRTELHCYCEKQHKEKTIDQTKKWITNHLNLKENITNYFYTHENEQAIEHLMSVACGLDSMIIGEPQILGQLKKAHQTAEKNKTTSTELNRLYQNVYTVAKQIRTQTDIGANAVTIAYAAVNLTKHIYSDITTKHTLLIGAGETIELSARHLIEQGITNFTIANRTKERAQQLKQILQQIKKGLTTNILGLFWLFFLGFH